MMTDTDQKAETSAENTQISEAETKAKATSQKTETGGPTGAEPTRYGDWERNGRCSDF